MENSNEAIVSPPGTIELGGKTYLVSKPTEKDIFSVAMYAKKLAKRKYNPIRETLDALAGLQASEEAKTAVILQAHRVQSSGEIPADAISEELMGAKGCAFYAWVLIRKNHPEVTLEQLQDLINEDNSIMVFADLDEVSGAKMIHRGFEDSGFFPQPSLKGVTGS